MIDRVFVALACCAVTLAVAPNVAQADDWTDWYSLTDGYRGKIDVRYKRSSIKAGDGRTDIRYQFRNRYKDRVSFTYRIIGDGNLVQAERVEELGGNGQLSADSGYARNTREIWVNISNLRAAGSHLALPRE